MTANRGGDSVGNDIERRTPIHYKTTTNYSTDEVAVRDLYQEPMDGWNRGGGEEGRVAPRRFPEHSGTLHWPQRGRVRALGAYGPVVEDFWPQQENDTRVTRIGKEALVNQTLTNKKKALIVGDDIGGPVAAMALLRA